MPVNIEKKNNKTGTTETKMYETVAERLRKFREAYPVETGWSLNTEISHSDNLVHCEARIISPDGHVVATGHAEEDRNGSFINKASAVENCETSAIGRCLFTAGFGGGEFCSADELLIALKRQEELANIIKNGSPDPEGKSSSGGNGKNQTAGGKSKTLDNNKLPKLEGVNYERQGNVIIAKGKTFSVKGLLQNAGFKWDSKLNSWAMYLS